MHTPYMVPQQAGEECGPENSSWRALARSTSGTVLVQVIDGEICYSVNPLDVQHYSVTCIHLVFHSLGDNP